MLKKIARYHAQFVYILYSLYSPEIPLGMRINKETIKYLTLTAFEKKTMYTLR